MKTLVILAHPYFETSSLNKQVVAELKKNPEQFTIHHLDETYPDGNINVAAEQQLVEEHDGLVLQFPIYWYNCPHLLKKWLDEVLEFNWAYGPEGHALNNKPVALVVTTGADESQYHNKGATMNEVLTPFKMTFGHTKSDYKGYYPIYGPSTTPEIVQDAVDFLNQLETVQSQQR